MRNLKVTLIAAGLLFFGTNVNAQKFGHINSAELLSAMTEVKTADKAIQDFANGLDAQLKTMGTEYQTKVTDFQTNEKKMTDPIKETKIREIRDLETRINDFKMKADQDLNKKQEEVYAPILKKAENAIKAVAKDHKIAYVFDTSKGVVIEYPDSDNILDLVKKKLGI